jgi:hypothetical protein
MLFSSFAICCEIATESDSLAAGAKSQILGAQSQDWLVVCFVLNRSDPRTANLLHMSGGGHDKSGEKELHQSHVCPRCGAQPRLLHSVPDFRSGKTARLFWCQCGERIWDEE